MPALAMGFLLCDFECKEFFLNKHKDRFKNISFVASKSDWNLVFTLGREKEITPEEIKRFENRLNKFYSQIKSLVEKYNLHSDSDVAIILNRLKDIKEEYLNYPFPNRELFFNLRLDFYLQQIQKAAMNKLSSTKR